MKRKFLLFIKKYWLLLVLFLFLCFAIPYTYAKYIESTSGKLSSYIDKVYYDIVSVGTDDTNFDDGNATYYFNIVNYDSNDNLNEVLMKYYLLINLPPEDEDDCSDISNLCEDESHKDEMKKKCPQTCGYNDGITSINFVKHLYYKDALDNWIEIPINASGDYSGYYTGYKNLIFSQKEVHEYKFVFSSSDNVVIAKDYPFSVNVVYAQTNS